MTRFLDVSSGVVAIGAYTTSIEADEADFYTLWQVLGMMSGLMRVKGQGGCSLDCQSIECILLCLPIGRALEGRVARSGRRVGSSWFWIVMC